MSGATLKITVDVDLGTSLTSLVSACELIEWRALRPAICNAVEKLLAFQGDRADPELIKLQHRLAELSRVFAGEQFEEGGMTK